MPLQKLSVTGFRNLTDITLELDPQDNYLFGPNGAGKTNLLEAVFYLAIGRSFRRCGDADLLGHGAAVLSVAGDSDGGTAEVRFDGREKRLLLNGARVERLSDYFGWLPVVVLLLDDIELVRGAPGVRRSFLDMAAAKADRGYIGVLGEYRRVLMQRNRLFEREPDPAEEEAWEEELIKVAVPVYRRRRELLDPLLRGAAQHFRRFGAGDIVPAYRSTVALDGDVAAAFRQRLAATRARSRELRVTLVGPHRDDIVIVRDQRELRRFGSVGEQRLAAIALRLAEADLLASRQQGRPVFLMDEVASELDEKNSGLLFELVAERGQMLYAAARRFAARGREYAVEAGQVTPVS